MTDDVIAEPVAGPSNAEESYVGAHVSISADKRADKKITFYSVENLTEVVLRMETGIPTKEVFDILVQYVSRFKEDIIYYHGWKVDSFKLADQILITLMKLRQNYTNKPASSQ